MHLLSFVAGQFVEKYDPTIEDFYRKEIDIDGLPGVIEILDTAGTIQFASMRDFRLHPGIFHYQPTILYDVRDQILRVKGVQTAPMLLVGNKCDLEAERSVTARDGQMLAQEWGIPFFETSAKTKHNVHLMFHEAVREVIKSKTKQSDSSCCTLL